MPVVECRDVGKRFYHYEHRTSTMREFFVRAVLRRPIHVRRAHFQLQGLDLRIHAGEAVALVGSNGSGKSTALRLIAGIYAPSTGVVITRGRVAAVIELGAGFHPDLTGEENAAQYAAVMGLSRREFTDRFPEMIDFAGVGDFLDVPVKYYSSGMQARLAFSVATFSDPDILLLDEVLAVGDQAFRERCFQRLREFHDGGGTLIVVSHDLPTVRTLCSRAAWLQHGRVRMDGSAAEVFDAYDEASNAEQTAITAVAN